MMMKRVASLFLLASLAGCSAPQEAPVQKAQQGKMSPERSLDMEALCKDRAARRYNSDVQKIDVTGFERFREAMSCGAIRRAKRALSARLMRTVSFYTSLCASLLA
ncbi:protein YsaB [Enterobacter asburiae]|uniref:Protein YsaB n=1 Tax=Enterobacter asburiae TaxID=61645 RepID=A0A376FK21_ENTAS|nr:protein YsaB [Enterobacter asburiae]